MPIKPAYKRKPGKLGIVTRIKGKAVVGMRPGRSSSLIDPAQARNFVAASPSSLETVVLCRRLCKRFGSQPVACLLCVPRYQFDRWCNGSVGFRPSEKRLVWLLYAVLMHPELVRSPFDILTSGRYVRKKFGGPFRACVGDESADWMAWYPEI